MSLHFLIDGYNVIKQSKSLKNASYSKEAPLMLVKAIRSRRLIGSSNNQATIVFDGKDNSSFKLKQGDRQIKIIFSREDSADTIMKKMVSDSNNPKQMVVVTDDKEIIFYTRSLGAKTKSVSEFLKEEQDQLGKQKSKQKSPPEVESSKIELTYQQQEKINQELRRIWK